MARIMIELETDELNALADLAEREHRDTRQQASLIIRQELERRGQVDIEGVASVLIANEIAADPALLSDVHEKVMDAVRGRAYARDWLLSREGRLWLDAFDRYLDEGGKVPKVLSGAITRR